MDLSDSGVTSASGGCLCGAVRFRVEGPLRPTVGCHCEQCRRTSGHFVNATNCAVDHLHFEADEGLRWYRSTDFAERGFCATCGSSLFYRLTDGGVPGPRISIMAGTLDPPTGLSTAGHIFLGEKSDYYEVQVDLPCHVAGYDSPLAR
ncbi:GFA family protein [Marivibrio halodurans]|uniref:GFA family protein n=1 Tax=Marivibrio halodurans TaxID=2039722 RepID=A0A8J7V4C7_9PROT|nr:GFA family protein [Marivibrio halodurans]